MKASRFIVLPAAAALAFGVAACGGDEESSSGSVEGGDLSGTIAIDGSSTVFPFAQAAAEQFMGENPEVKITVGQSGTSGGFEKFCAGEIDISDASRPIDAKEEVPICKKEGVEYRELEVARDGISIVTNPATEASCLTTDQLKQYWEKGSTVSNLSDLGDDADTGEPLPDAELSGYGPGTDSGTFEFFTEEVNGEEGNSRTDYQASEDDNVLVQGVAGTKGALGYFGFSYFEENQSRLKALQVENPKTGQCVAPSIASAQSNAYKPLSRPLFIYAKGSSFKRREVQAFLAYIFANEKAIATRARFVPLTTAQLKRARINFDLAIKAANRT